PFAPLALFRGYPDFLVSTFRARRSSNQTRQAMPVDRHDCIRTRSARHACAVRWAITCMKWSCGILLLYFLAGCSSSNVSQVTWLPSKTKVALSSDARVRCLAALEGKQ